MNFRYFFSWHLKGILGLIVMKKTQLLLYLVLKFVVKLLNPFYYQLDELFYDHN